MTTTQAVSALPQESPTLETLRSLIGGEWVDGAGATKEIRNPATGEAVSRLAFSSSEQIDEAVAAAKRAQREWAKVSVAARAATLLDAVNAIEAHVEEICRWISKEMGKTLAQSREELVDTTLLLSRASIEHGRTLSGQIQPASDAHFADRRVQVIYQPVGVTAFISPWNFPVEMFMNCIASMVMGNACVWKPSEWAPSGPLITARIFAEAGIPAGLLNVVWGGAEEGERLVAHGDVGVVCFTGSTAVGEQISRTAGVKRLVLELGGNGPLVILDDADLDRAVNAAVVDCFYQAGQVCTAAERVLVHEAVHDEFVSRVAEAARNLNVGDQLDEATEMGPLSDQRILDKVIAHVEDARAAGATIVTGGEHHGLFYQPTVITGVTPDMRIAREETFGPVLPVIKISSAEEALEIANDSEYGLTMAVFTSSLQTAYMMGEGLAAGQVNVNAGTTSAEVGAPFGGWKKSGIGRILGEAGCREFTNVKTLCISTG
jgi:acyl-CoA reductase-like NAD-dependent aldehyde dehydrogenase